MRIINITEEGRGGGPLQRIRLVAVALAKINVETLVLCPTDAIEFIEECRASHVQTKAMSLQVLSLNLWISIKYIFSFPGELYRLTSVLKALETEIVHCNGSSQVKAVLAAVISRKKMIWHMTDSQQTFPIRIMFKCLSFLPDGYIFSSHRSKAYYSGISAKITKKPNVIVSAPVDFSRINDRDLENWDESCFHVITLAYINRNKGIHHIAEAALLFQERKPELKIKFHIVGKVLKSQENYFKELDQFLINHSLMNLTFHGHQENVFRFLRSAKIYLCSSAFESSPMAVWEALSCGLPVVSADVGDVGMIIKDKHCGVLLQNIRAEEIYTAILNCSMEPQEVYQMGQNAIAASKKFEVEEIAKAHKEFYDRIRVKT